MSEGRASCLSLWAADSADQLRRVAVDGLMQMDDDGLIAPAVGEPRAALVTIQAIDPMERVVAVAFVAARGLGLVAVNGENVASGLQLLRHTDHLDVAGREYWVSAESAPLRTQYDPARHGAEVRCALTKAKLREGQDIVICPGVPGASCGVIYKAQAWDAVIEANRQMKCTNCGYRPSQSEWRPPRPQPRRELLDGLLRLAHHS